MKTEELQALSLQALKAHLVELKQREVEIDEIEKKTPLTKELADERAALKKYVKAVGKIHDLKVEAETKKQDVKPKSAYEPKPGTEAMVHLRIVNGKKFDPNTGKALTKPYTQLFSYAEWLVFKQNFKAIGFSIEEVLHDPYNEAKDYVTVK